MEHPCDAWHRSEVEATGLYPEAWIETLAGKDAWLQCPWWLDYPKGEYPSDEAAKYEGKLIYVYYFSQHLHFGVKYSH